MCSSHLKQCVHNFSVFDFLKETVSKVPDVGCSVVVGEDGSSKRRKAVDDESNVIDEESKRSKKETVHDSRGRCRRRGRGRRRGSHETEWDFSHYNKYEAGPETSPQRHEKLEQGENDFGRTELKEIGMTGTPVPVRDFDLNIDLDENGLATANPVTASTITIHEMKQEEYSSWPPITIDPLQLALMDKRIEEEEDYDNEDC
ncbi:hypothetical protein M5K25_019682 [Dendrobium thyrsiflorum]|uniref:Uncharacterized protein n=1 Tax=Dendrobium thyrsiflorum TaxID=117978 RepID=A0ABD0UFC1_DENTH